MKGEGEGVGGILTVTPNPSLDLLYTAERLVWDDANRIPEPRVRPGGQGLNVARAVAALGGRVEAVTLLGGASGAAIRRILAAEPFALHVVEAAAETRTFIAVAETETGRSLLINSPGPVRSAGEAAAFLDRVETEIQQARPAWVACCGSVPPGFDSGLYRRIGALARARDALFVPDCDVPALEAAVRDGCDLLVPNGPEAARLLGRPIDGPAQAGAAARELLGIARLAAAITLGPAGGVLATGGGAWHAVLEPAIEGSAVGAGDTFLAALLLGLTAGRAPPDALARAIAAAGATLLSAGTALIDPATADRLLERVRVRPAESRP